VKQRATLWQCGTKVVSLESPILVGIVNVTPDSFSDGGAFQNTQQAVKHACSLVKQGAVILDIGGESTRPGAERVCAEEQIARTEPVILAIRRECNVCISIDTTLASVARSAITAGADIINDVSAGDEDREMFSLAAETNVGIVLMHRRLPPELDQYSDAYTNRSNSEDIVKEVAHWLEDRAIHAIESGISSSAVAVDPGFGFGKSVEQNWQLVEGSHRFVELGYPVYVGLSRKSFIGATSRITSPELRDVPSVAAALEIAMQGVQIFRVHSVLKHVQMLQSLSSMEHKL
jgi:dihydropteroate synthase